ncbi:hypothetical protein [Streptomyces brasiliensis]|uniref:Uncharacterized protein n=1 Tax=Streptomyces brasiliensis TaxID=1954 RepID=A0A917K044_9ACTN|nr:hypothetical protein [Streptomyces brasiliensis]GGI95403.1 hypothetical protein GCM10010121_002370 [Streptomyces brasiliensis]
MGAELSVATQESDPAEALKAWDGGADLILNAARRPGRPPSPSAVSRPTAR